MHYFYPPSQVFISFPLMNRSTIGSFVLMFQVYTMLFLRFMFYVRTQLHISFA
jgi:hypothetical protein